MATSSRQGWHKGKSTNVVFIIINQCMYLKSFSFNRFGDGVVAHWGAITSQSRWRTSTTWRLEWRKMWWELIFQNWTWMRWFFLGAFPIWGSQENYREVLGWACLYSSWVTIISSSLFWPMFHFQFGLYMSQTSLMLTPTMEGWQDRELDAKTSYLMDNVKYTSRGTILNVVCNYFI